MTSADWSRRVAAHSRRAGTNGATFLLWVVVAGDSLAQATADGQSALATRVATTDRFEFHSDPWVNLHHFLYQWAREEEGLGTGRQHVPVPERASLAQLSDRDRRAWARAVAFYRNSVARRSHFDAQMVQQKGQLLELAGEPRAEPPDAIPGIAAALSGAMPVYWSRWWLDHDRSNRGWIAGVAPYLRRHEARYVEVTKRIYRADWSGPPLRVDVSAYANPRAGYTVEGHIVIYSTDPGNLALYGLETLLHEVQHTRDVGSAAREGLTRAF